MLTHQIGEFIDEFLSQRPLTQSFDVFFDPRPKKKTVELNNRAAGYLKRHCTQYDGMVMQSYYVRSHCVNGIYVSITWTGVTYTCSIYLQTRWHLTVQGY